MRKPIASGVTLAVSLAAGLALAMRPLPAQTPVTFEAASIRPANPPSAATVGSFHAGTTIEGTHLDLGFTSLWDLIPYALRAKQYQVIRPDWTRDSRWNILANLPAGTGKQQAPDMMRALLVDRFKLATHVEKREQNVYQLVVAPGGVKMETSDPNTFQRWDGSFPGFGFGGLLRGDTVITGRIIDQPNCGERWEYVPLPMSWFVDSLAMFLGRPVLDQTELKGNYKVVLDINAETMKAMDQNMAQAFGLPPPGAGGGGRRGPDGGEAPPPPAAPPGQGLMQCRQALGDSEGSLTLLFKAVQKLGLDLKQVKAPIDTVIVDHLEKTPTEN